MNKIVIFDLDDTLYIEKQFVFSGLSAVSNFIKKKYKINSLKTFNDLKNYYTKKERVNILDFILKKNNVFNKKNLIQLINIYRSHKPNIKIDNKNKNILFKLSKKNNIYLVTDGNKLVQKNKIEALKIKKFFKKIFITHQYAIKYSKPSLFCFNIIRKLEKCNWNDLIYIGDDPNKDFLNLNIKKAITIRINQGRFKNISIEKKYEAKYVFNNLKNAIIFLKNKNYIKL